MSRMRELLESALEPVKPVLELVHAFYLVHFLLGLGVIASLINWLVPQSQALGELLDILLFGIFVVVVLIVAHIHRRFRKLGPVVFQSERKTKRKYYIEIAPTLGDTKRGIAILDDYFNGDVIAEDAFMSGQRINPNCIVIAKAENGEVIGVGDFHGLKARIFDNFIAGEIGERDLDSESFLTRSEFGRSDRFYFGGISVKRDWRRREGEISEAIVKGILIGICTAYASEKRKNSEKIDIYSLGYTTEGTKLLERNGFFKHSEPTQQRSAPMYSRSTTIRELRHAKTRPTIGDFEIAFR